jgi:hypothetical protein
LFVSMAFDVLFRVAARRIASLVWVGLVAASLMATTLRAQCPVCSGIVRPQDQVWVVSSRGLGCGNFDSQFEQLCYYRSCGPCNWRNSNRSEFVAANDPTAVVCIFIHGNRMEDADCRRAAWATYYSLVQCAPEQSLRFIAWSWPSEQIDHRPIEDVRTKAVRSGTDAHYVARFVDRMQCGSQLCIIGYSYGARIATASLHLLGGGTIDGEGMCQRMCMTPNQANVVLEAAAMDSDWLLPGHTHGLALSQTNRLLLMVNECDPILKRYHFVYCGRNNAQALGFTGLACPHLLGDEQNKLFSLCVNNAVGKTHDWQRYVCASSIQSQILPYVFSVAETPAATVER